MTEESLYSLTMNTRRASRAQFEAMLRYIEERPHMVSKPCSRSKCVEEWERLADQLNGMLSGVTKTAFKWSRCWIDWKCSTRKKYASILQNKGDDPDVPSASLNELEIRLLPFIADSVMAGDSPLPDMDGTSTSTFLIKTPSKSTSNFKGINLSEDEAIQDHTYVSIIKQENSRETLNQQKDGSGSPTIVKITQPKRSSQEKFVICTSLDEYCSAESNHEVSEEDYIPKEKRKKRLKIKDKHVSRGTYLQAESRDGLKDEYRELLRMKGDNERNRLQCELERLKLMQREIKLRECALRLKRGNRFRCSTITYPLLKF